MSLLYVKRGKFGLVFESARCEDIESHTFCLSGDALETLIMGLI